MGLKRRPRVFLLAQPKRAPGWWPQENGQPRWVYVTDQGCGFSTVASRSDKMSQRDVREIKLCFVEVQNRKFHWRVELP